MNTEAKWHPTWWSAAVHGTAWERVKAAMQRDWTQTRHDLGTGGHELNQTIADTARQVTGKDPIPNPSLANPPKVMGQWSEAELPYGYGHAARRQFGAAHPSWTPDLELILKQEWTAQGHGPIDWDVALPLVRRGYDYDDYAKSWPSRVI